MRVNAKCRRWDVGNFTHLRCTVTTSKGGNGVSWIKRRRRFRLTLSAIHPTEEEQVSFDRILEAATS